MSFYNNFGRFEALAQSLPLTAGKVFLVADNSDAWFERLQRMFPVDIDGEIRLFSNLDTAVGACTAGRGDVIIVFPNYTMTVTAASGLNLDVAGITLLGLGSGTNKPTIDFTTVATADVDVGAANITVDNFRFISSDTVDVTAAIDVNAAHFTLKNCDLYIGDTSSQFTRTIVNDSNNYLTVDRCRFLGDTNLIENVIDIVGGEGHRITNSYFFCATNDSQAPIINSATATRMLYVDNNVLINASGDTTAFAFFGLASATGTVSNNTFQVTADAGHCVSTGGNLSFTQNFCTNNVGESGFLDPDVSVT